MFKIPNSSNKAKELLNNNNNLLQSIKIPTKELLSKSSLTNSYKLSLINHLNTSTLHKLIHCPRNPQFVTVFQLNKILFMCNQFHNQRQTQIWDNQLFDFDYQVEPLLHVLCGRILQLSRREVLQQEELNVMKNRQQELLLQEKAQKQKIKKMYDEEGKLQLQNAKKIQKFKKEKDKKIKTHKRLFSRVLAKDFLKNIKQNAINKVDRNGFFRNPLQIKIMNEIPQIFYQNSSKIHEQQTKLIDEAFKIAEQAKAGILKQHAWAKQIERTRRNQIIFKRQQLQREKKQRKRMKGEQKLMKDFLIEQKIQKQKQEEQRKRAQQAQQNGQVQAQQN